MPGLLRDLQLSDETSLQTTLIEVVARIKAKLAKHRFPERCRITAKDARVQLRYGLAIAPERISWD